MRILLGTPGAGELPNRFHRRSEPFHSSGGICRDFLRPCRSPTEPPGGTPRRANAPLSSARPRHQPSDPALRLRLPKPPRPPHPNPPPALPPGRRRFGAPGRPLRSPPPQRAKPGGLRPPRPPSNPDPGPPQSARRDPVQPPPRPRRQTRLRLRPRAHLAPRTRAARPGAI